MAEVFVIVTRAAVPGGKTVQHVYGPYRTRAEAQREARALERDHPTVAATAHRVLDL